MKIILDAIFGDAKTDQLMHACDVFEPFKRIGKFNTIEIVAKKCIDTSKQRELVSGVINALGAKGMAVSFIAIRSIDGKKVNQSAHYISPGVSVISDGKRAARLSDILSSRGYSVETDQHFNVLSAILQAD